MTMRAFRIRLKQRSYRRPVLMRAARIATIANWRAARRDKEQEIDALRRMAQ